MIRTAERKDAARIAEIYSFYVEETAISFEYEAPDAEEMARRMAEFGKEYPYIVYEDEGRILGYAYAHRFLPREAYRHCVEMTIYLDREECGKGLGRALYTEMEKRLKAQGITPEWIQVGNENGPGMLWDTDQTLSGSTYDVQANGVTYPANTANFANFVTTGSRAAKEVFPDTKVIVHLQSGDDNDLYHWIFDLLEENGAEYDVIGMSLYPEADNWQTMLDDCVANMQDVSNRYGKEVMVCETGMNWDDPDTSLAYLTELLARCQELPACLGVFYWEPQCHAGWNGYFKGAFDDSGRPTIALDAFKD